MPYFPVFFHMVTLMYNSGLYPVWHIGCQISLPLPFLEKQNICRKFRILKCAARQADSSKQVTSLGNIPPGFTVTFIKCASTHPIRGDHGNDASLTHLVNGLGEKIIMHKEIVPVIPFVRHFVISKRHIANDNIKEIIRIICLFKSCDLYICFGIELFCNPSGNIVKFHTIQPALLHFLRQHTKKIPDAH